jgi:hypothetical protein
MSQNLAKKTKLGPTYQKTCFWDLQTLPQEPKKPVDTTVVMTQSY